ncbi:MAG: hypothetical protein QXL10_03285 [Candidatus Bathyarchaeia archaeon]
MSEPVRPSVALVFGSVTPPQGDVVELTVHLGCSKEVGSFEVKLHNHDGKYSPGGVSPISVGVDGSISLGRGANCPLLITIRVEDVKYESSPTESYVTVSGRCWGERLFRRVVTKTYENMKGEDIVKDLLDYYVGLSHVRGGTELVEATDTTYTRLEYTDSPVWDILKYIAETADKAGVIGFDFRVAPDGKFEFFPKNSKTHPVAISDNIDVQAVYRKNISRVRNKILVYGLADKSVPPNKVDWTRSLNPADGAWAAASGTISVDQTGAPDGGACIKLSAANLYFGSCFFTLNIDKAVNAELYPLLNVQFKLDDAYSGTGVLILWDANSREARKNISISPDETWHVFEVGVGSGYANQWEYVQSGFDWKTIRVVKLAFYFPQTVGSGDFWIHGLYFGGRRYSAVREDAVSQNDYGLREYVEVDEELWSDNECDLRAKALLAYLKSPAEYLTVTSTLIDYGNQPILAGDKVHVELPMVSGDFRVESVEYRVIEHGQVLEITLELGKEPPQLADYLYGLRTFTVNVEKLSRTKMGKRGVPVATGGGGSGGSGSYFTSNLEIDKVAPVLNLLTNRVLKAALGFDGANLFLVAYAGDLILRSQNAVIRPYADGSDDLGNDSFRFNKIFLRNGVKVAGVDTIGADGRVSWAGMPRGPAGYVLEAQGDGYWPMYVYPHGRYWPAPHEAGHGNLFPAGGAGTGYCGSTSNYWACVAGDSVWYRALGQFDMLDDLAAIKRIKPNGKCDKNGVPLVDPESLPEHVRSEDGMIHAGHLMGLALGAIKQLNAKVEMLEKLAEAQGGR